MSEHDEKGEERVEDLDVPESESEDVKGGLLPATDQFSSKIEQSGFKQGFKQGSKFNKFSWGHKHLGDGSV